MDALHPDLITVRDAAALLKVSVTTMHRYVREGRLPHMKFGLTHGVRKTDVLAFGAHKPRRGRPRKPPVLPAEPPI